MSIPFRRHPGPTPAKAQLDHPIYRKVVLEFNYAIRFYDGTYYTGDSRFFGLRHEAFTYTMVGAHAKIERMGWKGATVERVL